MTDWKLAWRILGRMLSLVIVALLAAGATECQFRDTDPQTTLPREPGSSAIPRPDPLPTLGQTARRGNWQVTFVAQEEAATLRGFLDEERAQGEFRILTLILKNVGQRSYPLNDHDFSLVTPAGVEYSLSSDGSMALVGDESGPEVFWLIETVQPGLSKEVRVVFDVPPGATGLVLDVQGIRFRVPDSGSSEPTQATATAGPAPTATPTPRLTAIPLMEQFEILDWSWDQRTGWFVGEIRNNGPLAAGVELKATVRDEKGAVVDSAEGWPASTRNIPPNSTWPFRSFGWMKPCEGSCTAELRIVGAKVWRD